MVIYFLLRLAMYCVLSFHYPGPRIIYVKDFGCKADGITDDTQCIQRAIEVATREGSESGTIAFQAGKSYLLGR